MISFIEVCNYKIGTKLNKSSPNAFILNTCQRTLMIGIKSHPEFQELKSKYSANLSLNLQSSKAYGFLLEVICGLKSRLPGESEIINQFKESYEQYLALEQTNTLIMQFMEKLFQDAKIIRKNHLNEIKQNSYASITRSIIKKNSNSKRLLILGTGKLAEDLAKTLTKRYNIYIKGRNILRLNYLNEAYQAQILAWDSVSSDLLIEFPIIINTIGVKLDFLDLTFFENWQQLQNSSLFIDLSSPCSLPRQITTHDNIFNLDDVFNEGLKENIQAKTIINNALINIEQIVAKRKYTFTHTNKVCWDELLIN